MSDISIRINVTIQFCYIISRVYHVYDALSHNTLCDIEYLSDAQKNAVFSRTDPIGDIVRVVARDLRKYLSLTYHYYSCAPSLNPDKRQRFIDIHRDIPGRYIRSAKFGRANNCPRNERVSPSDSE